MANKPVSLFALHYSLICQQPHCGNQFEVLLGELLDRDTIACPKCAQQIDLTKSKKDGDLANIFREGAARMRSKSPGS
jgi:hypothetical protein